jgi:hypothetical protein
VFFLQAFTRCTLAAHKIAHPEKIVSRMSYLRIPHSKLLDIELEGFDLSLLQQNHGQNLVRPQNMNGMLHNENSSQTDMGFGLPAIMI